MDSRSDPPEEITRKLEDVAIETIQSKAEEKKIKNNKQVISYLWVNSI